MKKARVISRQFNELRKKAEELLRTQKKSADPKPLSDIGILAAAVAHGLRNPLEVIQVAIYNIRGKNKNPSLDKHLDNIEKSVLKSNQIINNLLLYSRMKKPHYKNINISNIISECIASAHEIFEKKVSIDNKLKLFENVFFEADPLQIRELFNNILSNAYDALIEDEGKIEIGGEYDGYELFKIYVKDNGCGISKEDLEKVYEPFFSKKSKGIGLGLTVCYQIVSLHNGKIEIESEKGQGTTVTVSLPIKRKIP